MGTREARVVSLGKQPEAQQHQEGCPDAGCQGERYWTVIWCILYLRSDILRWLTSLRVKQKVQTVTAYNLAYKEQYVPNHHRHSNSNMCDIIRCHREGWVSGVACLGVELIGAFKVRHYQSLLEKKDLTMRWFCPAAPGRLAFFLDCDLLRCFLQSYHVPLEGPFSSYCFIHL